MSLATTGAGRSKGQIAASTLLNGLLGAWPLDETTGNRLDRSGRGNHLAAAGAVAPGLGVFGTGARFYSADSDVLTLADASAADFELADTAWTIAAWVVLDTKAALGPIITKYDITGNQRSWSLHYNHTPDRFQLFLSSNGTATTVLSADTLGAVSIRTKYCVIAWYDPDANLAYISVNDGAADSVAHAGGCFNSSAALAIGRYGASTFLSGMVDECYVWNRILTPAERTEFYNSGDGVSYPFPGVAVTVVDAMLARDGTQYFPARVPHQRQCFYAAGLYWVFWSEQLGGAPYNLNFATSADGYHWSAPTNLTTIPIADAQWNVIWDGTYVHVARNVQTGAIFHDGLLYRRGTPGADGVITWAADWQTVIAAGSFVGDWSMCVGTDGKVWIGYGDSGSTADALVIKNDATDGTWSTAAGFPVALTATNDMRFPVVVPLAAGGVHATVYRYGTDAQALGFYSADGGAVFTAEGAITTSNVEADAGVGAYVACIEAASEADGLVHLAYQTNGGKIMYRQRSALGVWSTEVELDDGTNVTAAISSPRISFNGSGEIYIMWSTAANIYLCKYSAGAWGAATAVVTESLDAAFEHAMPAEVSNGTTLQLCYLTNDYRLRHRLVAV